LLLALLLAGCRQSAATLPHAETEPAPLPALPVLKWQSPPGAGSGAAPAQMAGGLIIIASETAVTAFAPQTGEMAWQAVPAGGVWPRSLAADENVVLVGVPGGLLALDGANGKRLWQQTTTGELLWPPLLLEGEVYAGTAFVGPGIDPDPEGRAWVYALNAGNGAIRWSQVTDTYALTTPAASSEQIIVGGSRLSDDDVEEGGHLRLHAFDRATGERQWVADRSDGFLKSLATGGRQVYYLAYTDVLYGLDAASGAERWRYPTENWSPGFVLAGGVIYLGSDNAFVHAVQGESGQAEWRVHLAGIFNAPRAEPAIAGNHLYFQSNDNRLYALDRSSGALVWQTSPQPRSRVALAAGGGHLFLVSQDGTLYAFAPP